MTIPIQSSYGAMKYPLSFFFNGNINSKQQGASAANYRAKTDSLHISGMGKLHIRGEETGGKTLDPWARVTGGNADIHLQLADKHISRAGNLLEQMKTLAESAQNEALSDLERIDMQIEMGRLQHQLDEETLRMENTLMREAARRYGLPGAVIQVESYEDSKAYKMLERARERIVSGEEWDVSEVNTPIVRVLADGERVVLRVEAEITDDATVPTVSDILKTKGRNIMDSSSAEASAAELGGELAGLAKQREKLISFIDKNGEHTQLMDSRWISLAGSLVRNTWGFLETLHREMYAFNSGPDKDENGNYMVYKDTLIELELLDDESKSLRSKTVEGEEISEATKIHVQLNSRPVVSNVEYA
jgi:hypothetical protein